MPGSPHAAERLDLLRRLYGDSAPAVEARAITLLAASTREMTPPWTQRDAWLIAYPDQFREPDVAPLATLRAVLDRHLAPEITGVHVLPFHPSSSDRGFSVMDFAAVDPAFGGWDDVANLARSYRLMADAVINHASAQSVWFRRFLDGDEAFAGFFQTVAPDTDLSAVVRPRTSALLTSFDGRHGPLHVWTTFSADQVDLDYRNPAVLLAVLDVLLSYRAAGAGAIRLDAVAFLWKHESSSSVNLPETHAIVQILRSWLDEVDEGLIMVTETNVPHAENVAYLAGQDRREAQAVYQFSLPPLILHTLASGDPARLVDWAATVSDLPPGRTFLNLTSSHDGIGLRAVEALMTPADVDALTRLCGRAGGVVNRHRSRDGSPALYELATTWYALMAAIDPDPGAAIARHLLSQAFVLALRGIPLLYIHALLASDNDNEGSRRTGIARQLNRADFDPVSALHIVLDDRRSRPATALSAIKRMLRWRAACSAFHPEAAQRVTRHGPVVVIERGGDSAGERPGDIARVYLNVATTDVVVPIEPGRWQTMDAGPTTDPAGEAADSPLLSTLRIPPLGSTWVRTR